MTKNDVLEIAKNLGMSDKSAIKYVNLAQNTFDWRDKKCIEKEIKAILKITKQTKNAI